MSGGRAIVVLVGLWVVVLAVFVFLLSRLDASVFN